VRPPLLADATRSRASARFTEAIRAWHHPGARCSQWYTRRQVHTPVPNKVEAPIPSGVERSLSSKFAHLLVLLAFTALFTWLFARFFLRPLYLAESDLYENGLPIFLSPIWKWSSFEFSGLPVLADPANFNFYLPNVVFGELVKSWTAVVMSGPLLAACLTYAYVFTLTRSKTAAMFAGLAYGLSEEMLERLRHINHVHVIAWLPLIVLSLDRLRVSPYRRRWVAVGAFAVGNCILAGHPQPAMYVMYCAGLYALVGIFANGSARTLTFESPTAKVESRIPLDSDRGKPNPESRLRWLAATAAMFALGILMSAVKALPLIEARTLVIRSAGLTFTRFVGPSLTAPQALSFVFPTILHGPTTELPTYVGVATLLLALIGLSRVRTDWRIAFWLVMALVGIGMALGTSTPLSPTTFRSIHGSGIWRVTCSCSRSARACSPGLASLPCSAAKCRRARSASFCSSCLWRCSLARC
jgi:hypothetical protein